MVAPAKKQNSYEEPGALIAQPINGFFHNHKLRDKKDEKQNVLANFEKTGTGVHPGTHVSYSLKISDGTDSFANKRENIKHQQSGSLLIRLF